MLPGALNAATIEIGGESLVKTSTPFGTPNALGVPSNDDFDIDYTVQSWIPTRTIVLKDFQADVFGSPCSQFSITEITVRGDPIQTVAIDVKPGEKNPVTITTGDPVRGKLPIAIYGSSTFNAGNVDLGSLSFGVNGWESNPLWCNAPQDLNKDGFVDLLCHFMNNSARWEQGLTTVHLNGRTFDDAYFHGTETVIYAPR